MLENTVEMVDQARKAGATIIYVPIQLAPGFNELSRDLYGILKGCKDGQVFEKGELGCRDLDILKRQPGDVASRASEVWTVSRPPIWISS